MLSIGLGPHSWGQALSTPQAAAVDTDDISAVAVVGSVVAVDCDHSTFDVDDGHEVGMIAVAAVAAVVCFRKYRC